jgi:hypothetical protein
VVVEICARREEGEAVFCGRGEIGEKEGRGGVAVLLVG